MTKNEDPLVDYLINAVELRDDNYAEEYLASIGITRESSKEVEPGCRRSNWDSGDVVWIKDSKGYNVTLVRCDNEYAYYPWIVGFAENETDWIGTRWSNAEVEEHNPVKVGPYGNPISWTTTPNSSVPGTFFVTKTNPMYTWNKNSNV